MAHLLISAAHKSSGKTTLSVGLCAAFHSRGHVVQAFKKGPDYIDPLWLQAATDRPCINLDFHTMGREEIRSKFARAMLDADLGLIEGNKGLYDGLDLDGSNSNAALAMLLHASVVLVLDAQGMTRGIAPLILGYQAFESRVAIVGVILNRLGGARHEHKLRQVIEHYTDVEVLGAVHHHAELTIVERHLGLVPRNEMDQGANIIKGIATRVADQVNLDRIFALAKPSINSHTHKPTSATKNRVARSGKNIAIPAISCLDHSSMTSECTNVHPTALAKRVLAPPQIVSKVSFAPTKTKVRIGIAKDAAFGFYYPDDLEAIQKAGAELVFFDCLHHKSLPLVDGLFLGGGFPETQMQALQANESMRNDIHSAAEAGMPIYAECGGLMYLARTIQWKSQRCTMVGVIPGDIEVCQRPQGRGYALLEETACFPWPGDLKVRVPAHEFHYSRLINLDSCINFAYRVHRGFGINGQHDGVVYKNLFASYVHLRNTKSCPWASRFVQFVTDCYFSRRNC